MHASVTVPVSENCCLALHCRLVQSSGMEEVMAMFVPVCLLSNNKLMTSGSHVCISAGTLLPASGCMAPQMGPTPHHLFCIEQHQSPCFVKSDILDFSDLWHDNRCAAAAKQLPCSTMQMRLGTYVLLLADSCCSITAAGNVEMYT